ncbi:MAG: putative glutamine amidotransferase [Pseudonocardiales bacterium]|nr:putative glutamine amidotransferase [Pseudonocardiales bacterium]
MNATAARPRIGVTAYREPAVWGVWDEPADLLPATYADAVAAAGGVPMLLPCAPFDDAAVTAVLDGVAGLVLAGGADVDPARYGAAADPHTGQPRADRDAWEFALVRAALDRDLPLLAICRGMQVLNVAFGGALVQHLPDTVGSDLHCPTPGRHARHEVRVDAASCLGAVLPGRTLVATHHHQAVSRLGTGLAAVAWSDDGTVEAVELADRAWAVGVQWHPEAHDGAAVFAAFVAACARSATRSAVRA